MQSDPSNQKIKSPDRSLAQRLVAIVGLCPAQATVAVEIVAEHVTAFLSDTRSPGVIVHCAVSTKEPAGKPIKCCKLVPVRLTSIHEADVTVFEQEGPVELRTIRLYRYCREAQQQGGLLSYEDLAFLLCVDVSTVKDIVARLRERGLFPPTRGAIKDIGPEPSHKRIIADQLGRGFSTSRVGSATGHSEHAIGRYQLQFGAVLYFRHRYPDATEDQLCQLADLSPKAWQVYAEVAAELELREDCLPHLERIRRRYELDPEHLARQAPPGKQPEDLARQRLEQQTLETGIRQTIQEDLGTTRRVAETVTDDLLNLVDQAFPVSDRLRPGQAVLFVDAHDPGFISGKRVSDRDVIPVVVPLCTDEVKEIWRSEDPVGTRRARIATLIASAAGEQGGVMTVAGLAELLHASPATMAADLRKLAIEVHMLPFTKGFVEDAGQTLTHKDWIVDLDQHGLSGEEISWLTRHAPSSRDRYIETFRRAQIMMRLEGRIPEADELARSLRLRRHVARQYLDLLQRFHGPRKSTQEIAPT